MITLNNINYYNIPNFTGYYISKTGEIFSKKSNQILKQQTVKKGYKRISLMLDNGKKKTYSIHSLVLLTFVGKRPANLEIRHKDSNPANNSLENLEYCTTQTNTNDKFFQNRKFMKLTASQAIDIAKDKRAYKEIAKDYNITASSVSDIKCGFVWGKVTKGLRYQRQQRSKIDYILERYSISEICFILDKNNTRQDIAKMFNLHLCQIKRIRRLRKELIAYFESTSYN